MFASMIPIYWRDRLSIKFMGLQLTASWLMARSLVAPQRECQANFRARRGSVSSISL